jgi:hypothetical protein
MFVLYVCVVVLCNVGDITSKRHGASRKYKLHHHNYHHNHHHNKHCHRFNHPLPIEHESNMNVETSASVFKQTQQSGVQNLIDFENAGYENSDISSRVDQVLHSWESGLQTEPRNVLSVNEEQNELGNVASAKNVDNSASSNIPNDILARTHSENPTLPLQYSFKNNVLYDKKYTDVTPNHIERLYHRTSTKQKNKNFFPYVSKDVSVGDVATIRSSSDNARITSHNLEHSSRFGGDVLNENVVSKESISHTTYHDNDHILSADKSTGSYSTRDKLSENIHHEMLNKGTPNQTGLLQDADRNTYNLSGYHQDRNSIQYRHSHNFQQMDGRSFRSLVEPISPGEFQEVNLHWPVKREAVVEGDLILGGLMMVHEREDMYTCGPVMPQGGIQALETMLYTLDVLNRDPKMIPNVTLGAHILDDCDKDTYGLEMAVDFIKGRRR